MMFMMPMPPTSREIDAIAPSTTLKIALVRCSWRNSASGIAISKSTTELCRRVSIRRTTSATPGTSVDCATRTMMRSSWLRLPRSRRCSSLAVSALSAVTTVTDRPPASTSRSVICARLRKRSSIVRTGT